MCDQTEVTYSPSEVVWVKLGPVWWPGQVQDYDTLDEEITSNFKKKPIAVVKFFQEDSFEYVKNLHHIYRYNCQKKEEFIKKGLDMVRSSNSRDVPSNMKMFPNDVVMAEHLTGGNPNILDEKTFAPEQKSSYSNLFGSKKLSGKKSKVDIKKEADTSNLKKKVAITPMKHRRSLSTLPSQTPRLITHPRFIVKALEGRSDHEVRIRCQFSSLKNDEEITQKKYTCHICGFQASRLNVIILHNKSHSAGFSEAYKIKPQNKTKEREPVISEQNSLSEKTPTVMTSRGRVKVLPKKLLDYTDEPLPKMLKEKSSNKYSSEKTPEVLKRSAEKITAKKEKSSSEKLVAKRPLFGKRKSVKEKAELAAKQKQDNEVMKETLLKDWDDDDDDINQGEVELERLKQTLESTSSDISDDNCKSLLNSSFELDDTDNLLEKLEVTTDAKTTEDKRQTKTEGKAEVFEFDDSEDSFPVAINFRPKNQREQKFTDDKFKKPKPPKPLSKITSKNKSSASNLLPVSPSQHGDMEKNNEDIERNNEDLETAEFNDAFNALLQETVVPDIPEIPKTINSVLSDQTSDISSTTDLMAESDGNKTVDKNPNLEAMEISQSCDADNSFKVECSSSGSDLKSDFEDSKSIEKSSSKYEQKYNERDCPETQKNANDVSAFDPRVEMDSQFLSSGVPPITAENETQFEIGSADDKVLQTYVTAVEITSSCDSTKATDLTENFGQTNESNEKPAVGLSGGKTSTDVPAEFIKSLEEDSNECVNEVAVDDKQSILDDSQTGCPLRESDLVNNDADVTNLRDGLLVHHEHIGTDKDSCNAMLMPSAGLTTLSNAKEEKNSSNESRLSPSKSFIKHEENNVSKFDNSLNKEHKIRMRQDESQLKTVSSAASHSNVQLLLPVSSEYNTVHVVSQQQSSTQNINTFLPNHELSQTCTSTQNLQDMELDINSMPVIIGGEDFIQPDETKNLTPIQPKYSESIVVSPKTVPSPSKPEGLIMKIEVPTSSQHLQPLINIPSKSTRGGVKGGRTQKATSKTIKLSASTLKNLGNLHKGGNQQVLILKTASGQDKPEGCSDKSKSALNMVQHGNKILIVNNTQMSGQTAIKLNPQQLLSGGKLSPGTRVFTSKVASATTSSTEASSNISKTTLSRSPSKPTKNIVFNQAGGILSTTSKSVIINSSSGKLITVPSTQTVTTSKGKSLITHSILGSKSSLILPSPSQNAPLSSKPSTVLTSQTLSPSQSTMILAPITSKGGTVLAGNQKLRIVSSKAPISGTRFVVQNSQGKFSLDPLNKNQQLKLVSGLKGAQQGSTFLIKTSQGIFTKPLTSSSITMATKQPTIRASTSKTILTTIPTQAKISGALTKTIQSQVAQHSKVQQQPQVVQSQITTTPKLVQQSQIVYPQGVQTQVGKQEQPGKKSQTVKRLGVQKSRQSPNIIQKTQRKTTPRTPKPRGNRFISPAIKEPVGMATCSNLPVIGQTTMVQGQISQNSDVLYLTVDESGNYRPLDKSLVTIERGSETPSSLFIPANSQPQEVGNIFIAIDESGNIINITQPTPNVSVSSHNTTGQDILAKALENTQVLQQETIIPDIDVTEALGTSSVESSTLGSSFSDRSQYIPTLSHSVLETSLTLNQPPIMTPLEVPSVVSPNLGSMSALPTNFIASNLLSTKPKPLSPSMPLLTEEALSNRNRSEQVFLLDSSNSIIPTASGSQISLQLALNDSNVIVSSGSGCASIAPSFRVVSGDMIPSELDMSNEVNNIQNIVQEECIIDQDHFKVESDENPTLNIHAEQYQESLETPLIPVNQNSMIIQEVLDAPQENVKYENETTGIPSFQHDNEEKLDIAKEDKLHHVVFEEEHNVINHETIHTFSEEFSDQGQLGEENENLLKRGFEEEPTVSSSSDLEDDPKRMKIDER